MTHKSEQLTALIEEMDTIEQLAASFQAERPTANPNISEGSITELRQRYLDWYARCLSLLGDSGKRTFAQYYQRHGFDIHSYISNPIATEYRSGSHRNQTAGRVWRYKFERFFQEPFNEQRLLLMRVRATTQVREAAPPTPPPPPAIDTIRLHTRIRAVSSQLFKDGHYRQAILQACLALNEAVQQRSGRNDLDGTSLMQHVFSTNNPLLKFEGHPDEQQGYMWLYSGLTMAIRNPRAHKVGEAEDLDANEALEILAMVSVLFRALDSATTPN